MIEKIIAPKKFHLHLGRMTSPYYPNLHLGAIASLLTLRQQSEMHGDYLDNEACPYDEDTKDQLRRLLAPTIVEKVVEVPVEKIVERIVEKRVEVAAKAAEGGGKRGPKPKSTGVSDDEIGKEIGEIRQELKQLKVDGRALQVADKIQIIKTRAALVEKMLSMSERVQNVKRLSLFQSVVMGVLDDLMTDELRQEFMKRLEPFAATEA